MCISPLEEGIEFFMGDRLLKALAKDSGIQITAALTTGMVERARAVHGLSPLATAALGRTLTAAAIMGSQLKVEDGSVTIQIKGDGPLGAIVCVGAADGTARGYLQNPMCELPLKSNGKLDVGGGVGRGYLMVIKDLRMKDPVTGTVSLVNGEIAEDLTRYFAESEQVPSACALGVLVDTDRSVKCAGGFLVQLMPGVSDADVDRLEMNLSKLEPVTVMLEKGQTLEEIVKRVLEGFEPEFLSSEQTGYKCACSRSRVERALISMGRDELSKMADEQENSEVTCQFCDKVYNFTREELYGLLKNN